MRHPKILFLLTEDSFFCSHFIDRALAAKKAGFDITVVARESHHANKIRSVNLHLIHIDLKRSNTNPLNAISQILKIIKIYQKEQPDIVHHVALKPILYGTLAALITKLDSIINAPVGMGYIFSSNDFLARILRPIVLSGFRFLLNPRNGHVIFENSDDLNYFIQKGFSNKQRSLLIKGSGVDVNIFRPQPKKGTKIITVAFIARMLKDKGFI